MILIINTCYENLSEYEFVKPIVSIVSKLSMEYEIKHYSKLPNDLLKYDKIIICGTAFKDNYYINDIDKFSWLKKITIPVLGICSGMQVLCLAYGAEIEKKKEIGMIKVKTLKENLLFENQFEVYALHENSLVNLNSFEILAKSKTCVQAVKHNDKHLYGILFHPEVRNESIVINFLEF